MDNSPFAMSFEEIMAQADANMRADKNQTPGLQNQPTQQNEQIQAQPTPTGGGSFLDMVEAAERALANEAKEEETVTSTTSAMDKQSVGQTEGQAMSFDELYASAQEQATIPDTANQSAAPTFDNMLAQATKQSENVTTSNQSDTAEVKQSESLSFDNLLNMAQSQIESEQPVEETVKEADQPTEETVKEEEQPAEETVKEADQPAEKTVKAQEELSKEIDQTAEENAKAKEPAKEETGKKSGRRSTKKKEEKEVEKKEPLPDNTENYKVDVLGEGDVKQKVKKEGIPVETEKPMSLTMKALFTQEEIDAFRSDIRTLVRKEFKQALVGAVKDLLADFNE